MVNVKVSEQQYRNFLVRMGCLFEGYLGNNYTGHLTKEAYKGIGFYLK